jgi:hypothetical protein
MAQKVERSGTVAGDRASGLRSPLWAAAKLTVEERHLGNIRFVRYRPLSHTTGAPPVSQNDSPVGDQPAGAEPASGVTADQAVAGRGMP